MNSISPKNVYTRLYRTSASELYDSNIALPTALLKCTCSTGLPKSQLTFAYIDVNTLGQSICEKILHSCELRIVYLQNVFRFKSSLENYYVFQYVFFFWPVDLTFDHSIYTRPQNKKKK